MQKNTGLSETCVYVMVRLTAFTTVNSYDARLMVASHHLQSACNLIISFY